MIATFFPHEFVYLENMTSVLGSRQEGSIFNLQCAIPYCGRSPADQRQGPSSSTQRDSKSSTNKFLTICRF